MSNRIMLDTPIHSGTINEARSTYAVVFYFRQKQDGSRVHRLLGWNLREV